MENIFDSELRVINNRNILEKNLATLLSVLHCIRHQGYLKTDCQRVRAKSCLTSQLRHE